MTRADQHTTTEGGQDRPELTERRDRLLEYAVSGPSVCCTIEMVDELGPRSGCPQQPELLVGGPGPAHDLATAAGRGIVRGRCTLERRRKRRFEPGSSSRRAATEHPRVWRARCRALQSRSSTRARYS